MYRQERHAVVAVVCTAIRLLTSSSRSFFWEGYFQERMAFARHVSRPESVLLGNYILSLADTLKALMSGSVHVVHAAVG